jgi:hypothetical protein
MPYLLIPCFPYLCLKQRSGKEISINYFFRLFRSPEIIFSSCLTMKSTFLLFFLLSLGRAFAQGHEDKLLYYYLKCSAALSKSDYKKAIKHAAPLLQECRSLGNSSLLPPAGMLEKASGLSELRAAFSGFSDSLALAIRTGKIKPSENLFLVHCPMAFDDRGADWISDEARVINPYFGDEMLHCGSVKGLLKNSGK